jgi:cobalamin synthase
MLALLAPLASLLGIEVDSLRENLTRRAIVWGIIGVFAVVFFAFLLVAVNSALSFTFGPVVAPLMIAGAALFIALVVFLIGHLRENAQARKQAEEKHKAEVTALITSVAITAAPLLLKSSLIKEVGIPAGGALLAAYLLTRQRGAGKKSPTTD